MSSTAYRVINAAPVPAVPRGHIGDLPKEVFLMVFAEILDFPSAVAALTWASPFLVWKNGCSLALEICHISPDSEVWLRSGFWWMDWEDARAAEAEALAGVVAAALALPEPDVYLSNEDDEEGGVSLLPEGDDADDELSDEDMEEGGVSLV
ncbi:hypothetical protein IQ07DRAFT_588703 [Pyrenochaeta sp. DS3sAY3a]|nr:hypothetical protein IQ07DRAFT_588703 [Pyrenochaeta sp. DS3sAY3a]